MIKLIRLTGPPFLAVGTAYLGGYLLLDILCDAPSPQNLGISPWHLSLGLSILLIVLRGPKMLPLIVLAPFASELIERGDIGLAAIKALPAGICYGLAATLLRRPQLRFDAALTSLREVFVLMVAVIVSSALVVAATGGQQQAAGYLAMDELSGTALTHWVGDMVGIATVTPFGLLVLAREGLVRPNWQTALQVAIIVFALAVAVGSAEQERLQLYFLLFLPITWIAVSSGLEGVSMALTVTQIGLIAALHYIPGSDIDILALQARMLVLAATGLVAGALVTEARRAEQELRDNQAAIARLSRLGSMGELAIAIAHEVNQPLSAAGTYSRMVTESLEAERLQDSSIIATARKATAQVERAADVIRRLRTLVRLGRSELLPTDIEVMLQESLDLVRLILERGGITVTVEVEKELPPVMADRVQIEQVLFNLLRNSVEAISSAACQDRLILLQAERSGPQVAQLRVSDSGPGFPEEIMRAAPTLFSSQKADGLGVGLSLCRSIVEAHGGALRLESGKSGATVSFTLPFAEAAGHER